MSGTSARYKTTITHSPMTIHSKSNCRIEDGAGAEAACRDSATCTAASSSAEATPTTTDGHGSDALGAHLDAVPLSGISVSIAIHDSTRPYSDRPTRSFD